MQHIDRSLQHFLVLKLTFNKFLFIHLHVQYHWQPLLAQIQTNTEPFTQNPYSQIAIEISRREVRFCFRNNGR